MRCPLSFALRRFDLSRLGLLVAFPAAAAGTPRATRPPPAWITHNVRVDTVGYTTGHAKVATVVLPDGMTTLSDTTAEVFDLNGNLQWACEVTGPFTDTA